MAIGADGGVYPCASFSVHGGSLKEHSLEDIWNRSKLLNDVRHTTMKDFCPLVGLVMLRVPVFLVRLMLILRMATD